MFPAMANEQCDALVALASGLLSQLVAGQLSSSTSSNNTGSINTTPSLACSENFSAQGVIACSISARAEKGSGPFAIPNRSDTLAKSQGVKFLCVTIHILPFHLEVACGIQKYLKPEFRVLSDTFSSMKLNEY